jgi:hypothetical protein
MTMVDEFRLTYSDPAVERSLSSPIPQPVDAVIVAFHFHLTEPMSRAPERKKPSSRADVAESRTSLLLHKQVLSDAIELVCARAKASNALRDGVLHFHRFASSGRYDCLAVFSSVSLQSDASDTDSDVPNRLRPHPNQLVVADVTPTAPAVATAIRVVYEEALGKLKLCNAPRLGVGMERGSVFGSGSRMRAREDGIVGDAVAAAIRICENSDAGVGIGVQAGLACVASFAILPSTRYGLRLVASLGPTGILGAPRQDWLETLASVLLGAADATVMLPAATCGSRRCGDKKQGQGHTAPQRNPCIVERRNPCIVERMTEFVTSALQYSKPREANVPWACDAGFHFSDAETELAFRAQELVTETRYVPIVVTCLSVVALLAWSLVVPDGTNVVSWALYAACTALLCLMVLVALPRWRGQGRFVALSCGGTFLFLAALASYAYTLKSNRTHPVRLYIGSLVNLVSMPFAICWTPSVVPIVLMVLQTELVYFSVSVFVSGDDDMFSVPGVHMILGFVVFSTIVALGIRYRRRRLYAAELHTGLSLADRRAIRNIISSYSRHTLPLEVLARAIAGHPITTPQLAPGADCHVNGPGSSETVEVPVEPVQVPEDARSSSNESRKFCRVFSTGYVLAFQFVELGWAAAADTANQNSLELQRIHNALWDCADSASHLAPLNPYWTRTGLITLAVIPSNHVPDGMSRAAVNACLGAAADAVVQALVPVVGPGMRLQWGAGHGILHSEFIGNGAPRYVYAGAAIDAALAALN